MSDYQVFTVAGEFSVVDAKTGKTVASGGEVHLGRAVGASLVAAGVVTTETTVAHSVACPLCVEQGVKKPPEFKTSADLETHYQEKHAGFVVPTWEGV